MNLAGIEIRYLVDDIAKKTEGYYVSNIYGITKESILFKLHHPQKEDVFLMLSTFGLWITEIKIQQIEPNNLVRRLRNDLLRLRITNIRQLDAERIVYITFSGFDKEFVLVAELFGDGNLILCNNEMKILALHHSLEVRHRKLKVGLTYVPPPQNSINIFCLSQGIIDEIQNSDMMAGKWVGRTLGLSSKYVDEIFRMATVDPKTTGKLLSSEERKKIFTTIVEMVDKITSGRHDPIIVRGKEKSEVYPIKVSSVGEYEQVSSFNKGLDIVFTDEILAKGKELHSSTENKKIQQLQNQLDEQQKAIDTVKTKSEAISKVAKTLFELTSRGIMSLLDDTTQKELKKLNATLTKERGIDILVVCDEKIKINPHSSLPSVASILFDEAKKQSAAISSIERLIKKTQKNIAELKNAAETAKKSVTYTRIRKRNWFERYRWFYTSDGLLAIGGRDSSSNSSIIRKHLGQSDRVFHAEIFGSPFFLLKECTQLKPASIKEVAQATVCFSRAWRESVHGMNAYWVYPNQIKKAAPSGQFLPKGSFIVAGQKNFVKVPSLRLAVGIIKKDGECLLVCGPPEAVKKSSSLYGIIEPGGNEITDAAKRLRTEFLKIDQEISQVSLDEFVRALPAGKSHIINIYENKDDKETSS